MNKINNKIPWGLAIGTLGVTITGAFNGTAILGLASITGEDKAQSRVGSEAKITYFL